MSHHNQSYIFNIKSSVHRTEMARFPKQFFSVRRAMFTALFGGAMVLGWSLISEPVFDSLQPVSKSAMPSPSTNSKHLVPTRVHRTAGSNQNWQSAVAPSPYSYPASSLIHVLLSMDGHGALTEQQTLLARSNLVELVLMGTQSISDIRNFLNSQDDVIFITEYGEAFEYSSLRIALLDVLRQIGGLEAEQALLEQLDARVTVAELAAIADALEWLQPGFYTKSILEVARNRLVTLPASSASADRAQLGPLFRILQDYGNAEVAKLLYQAPYWLQAYGLVALANLPDGNGITGLARKVKRDLRSSRESRSLHLLAQVAVTDPQAEMILLDLVQSDQIPETFWPTISDILMGDQQLQIEDPSLNPERMGPLRGDNPYAIHTTVDRQVQIVYSVNYSAMLSAEEVAARLGLISRLLNETVNPLAISALWDARATLEDYY